MRSPLAAMALLLALSSASSNAPSSEVAKKPTPRRFTDARIAEAEAKRLRKQAKRAASRNRGA